MIQSMARGKFGRGLAYSRFLHVNAVSIQALIRGRQGTVLASRHRGRVEAAIMIQKIARKNKDVQRFFKYAKERRLATNFQDDYEYIGRHSESGRMRKVSQGQVQMDVVFEGALKVGGETMVCSACTEKVAKGGRRTIFVTCSSTLTDECFRTELRDGDVQAVLGMMSGVETAVQEGGIKQVLRSMHVREEVRGGARSEATAGAKRQHDSVEMISLTQHTVYSHN